MSSPLEAAIPYQKRKSDQTCDYCGAVFEVVVPGQLGHNEREEYRCPECNKKYQCRGSNSPDVSLKCPRTDGRTDRFPQLPLRPAMRLAQKIQTNTAECPDFRAN